MPDHPESPLDRRRDLGAFYTPDHIATHMAALLPDLDANSRVLEPSGGDGALARAVLATGHVRPDQIDVWDTDPDVAPALAALGVRFAHRDSLLQAPPPADLYSHVIGNPPYLSKQSAYIKANRIALQRRYKTIGVNDTYAMFLFMALEQLRPGGHLVFLISDTFLTLGVHRRLREHLLHDHTLHRVTLLPADTFVGATVRTAIVHVSRSRPAADHHVAFIDARTSGDLETPAVVAVSQAELLHSSGSVLTFDPAARAALRAAALCPPLMSACDGGLGMFTRDNGQYLAVIDHPGGPLPHRSPDQPLLDPADVDGNSWRPYHKRGGAQPWWRPAEHAVRWDAASVAAYTRPATSLAGEGPQGDPRAGIIISGVAQRLTARLATPGALWESNKAFAIFPRDPKAHPPAFLCAILNSAWYALLAHALNHTVSFQSRDLAALPLLPFTADEVALLERWGAESIEHVRSGRPLPVAHQGAIDDLVAAVAARVAP